MIFALDHIVFAVSQPQQEQLLADLPAVGFRPEQFRLEFPEIGAASESLSFPSGGFVEFVVETDSSRSPRVWFSEIPRVIGLGFASDDFDADTSWREEAGAWLMDEQHLLPDGRTLRIHAAGPHHHQSDFYVFVMDRPNQTLEFPHHTEGPVRLRTITLRGADATAWQSRLQRWLRLPASSESTLMVGDVELRFQPQDRASVRATPTFAVADRPPAEFANSLLEFVLAAPPHSATSG